MSTVEEHFAALRAMKPREGGWMTEEFQFHAVLLLGAHLDELEAAWRAYRPEDATQADASERSVESSPRQVDGDSSRDEPSSAQEPTREAAPSGWRVVPEEPTEAMVAAAVARLGLPWREIQRMLEAYRTMLAAAPSPAESRPNGDTGSEAQAEHRDEPPSPTPTAEEVAQIVADAINRAIRGRLPVVCAGDDAPFAAMKQLFSLFQPEGRERS